MMISFEILPRTVDFTTSDNAHIRIDELPEVLEIIRFRDASPHYKVCFIIRLLPPRQIKPARDGRVQAFRRSGLAAVIRPKVESRARRAGPVSEVRQALKPRGLSDIDLRRRTS